MVTATGTAAVDMTRTRFCDSAGLHALLGAIGARAEGGEVRFVVTSPAWTDRQTRRSRAWVASFRGSEAAAMRSPA